MKILVTFPTRPSFVARDIKILASQHDVSEHQYFTLSPANLLRGLRAVAAADFVYLWFASLRALPLVLFARFLGKNVITVVGGYEAANCPELHYGSARSRRQGLLVGAILRRSRFVLAVSQTSRKSIIQNYKIGEGKVNLLYHGFEDLAANATCAKRPIVLTVGRLEPASWIVKGMRDFFLAAAKMPDIEFVHVGKVDVDVAALLGNPIPANVRFIGFVPFSEIGKYYEPAQVYLQASRHESFGCAVAEAMLFRCIPVVRHVAALPEVVGDTGVTFAEDADISILVEAIRRGLQMNIAAGENARQRILTKFSYEIRQSALLELVGKIESNGKFS